MEFIKDKKKKKAMCIHRGRPRLPPRVAAAGCWLATRSATDRVVVIKVGTCAAEPYRWRTGEHTVLTTDSVARKLNPFGGTQ